MVGRGDLQCLAVVVSLPRRHEYNRAPIRRPVGILIGTGVEGEPVVESHIDRRASSRYKQTQQRHNDVLADVSVGDLAPSQSEELPEIYATA